MTAEFHRLDYDKFGKTKGAWFRGSKNYLRDTT